MQKIIKGNILFLIVLAIGIVFTFWNLPQTFYQQDEWQALGHNLVQGIGNITNYASPIQLFFGEGRPLGRALNLIFFGFFKFTVIPAAIFAIFLHALNAFLVFYLVKKLTAKYSIAFFASLFFAANGVSHQAVIWAAALGTLPATTFVLLAILNYLKFFEKEEKKWLFYSFFLMILSLLFKEVGSFLFIFFPLLYFFYSKRPTLIGNLKVNFLFIIYGLLAVVFRLSELFFETERKVGVFVRGGSAFGTKVLFHLILYPLTGLFQIFYPDLPIYKLADTITRLQYPFVVPTPLFELTAQTIVTDSISLLGAVAILMTLWMIDKIGKYKNPKFIIFSVSLILLSFLPYAVLDRGGSYMDSRYYYVAAIGAGMIVGYIFQFFLERNLYIAIFVTLLGGLLFVQHIQVIRKDISSQAKIAKERLYILNTLKQIHPSLNDKNIFYITSDRDYIGPNNKLPFQEGLGYTLIVWYYDTGKIPQELLNSNFLWDIGSQGYKEINSSGFGYFSDLNTMMESYKKYNLSPKDVISFYWDGEKQKLIDTTSQTRKLLK